MKVWLKSYLLINRFSLLNWKCGFTLCVLFLFLHPSGEAQVTNYVSNGGFEEISTPPGYSPKFWSGTDTLKPFGQLLSTGYPYGVPLCSYTYQWPRHGINHLICLQYCTTCPNNKRVYSRNRLKQVLQAGEVYCVTMYINLSNQSTHGIDAIGAYFSDISIDTITKCNLPITYLSPQIQNPVNNIIVDTLNWVPITGTFVANGTEKYMLIGNFRSDASTNKTLVNTTNLPGNFGDYLFDDVSCININLPAYAGLDKPFSPGDSVFIGRQPDVGIDEACMWYKLPTTITPTTPAIDTVAGLWVKPTSTSTYVVKQQLWCSSVKYDTVVVFMDLVGWQRLEMLKDELKIYPVPANDNLELRITNEELFKDFDRVTIYNQLGQLVKEEDILFKEKSVKINTGNLPNGVYSIVLASRTSANNQETVSKRFVISR